MSTQAMKRPKLRGGFLDERDSDESNPDDEYQTDLVHDKDSPSNSRVKIFERESDAVQIDADVPDSLPATSPPKLLPSSTRMLASSTAAKGPGLVNKDKLNRLMALKKQHQSTKCISSSGTSRVQGNMIAADTSSLNRAQISVQVGQGPISSASKASKIISPPTLHILSNASGPGQSKMQAATDPAPHVSLSDSTNVNTALSHSTSEKSASNVSRPNRSFEDSFDLSKTELGVSAQRSGPPNTPLRERPGVADDVGASPRIAATQRSGQGGVFHRHHQSSTRAMGGARVVGDLLQDIRQAGQPPNAGSQLRATRTVMQNDNPGHPDQVADRPETIKNTEEMQAEEEMCLTMPSRIQSKPTRTLPSGWFKAKDKSSKVQSPEPQWGPRGPIPQAQATDFTISRLQASRSTSSTPKRKAAAMETSSSLDFPVSKKTITTNLRSPTPIISSDKRRLSPSTVEPSSSSTANHNKSRLVSSVPATKPKVQANSPRTTVYRTLHTTPVTKHKHKEHVTTSKSTQLLIAEPNTTTPSSKVKSSSAIETPIKPQTNLPQPRVDEPRNTILAVIIPTKSTPANTATAIKDPVAPKIFQTVLEPKFTRAPIDTANNAPGEALPQASTSMVQQKIHQETPQSVKRPVSTIVHTASGPSASRCIRNDPGDAVSPERLAKGLTPVSNHSGSSNLRLAEKPTTSTVAQPHKSITSRQDTSNAGASSSQGILSRADATGDKLGIDAQQADAKAKEQRADIAVSTPEPAGLQQVLNEKFKVISRRSENISDRVEPHTQKKPEPSPTTMAPKANVAELQPSTHEEDEYSVIVLPNSTAGPTSAEPYFEYSVFRKIWSNNDTESIIAATELTSAPCTNTDEANAHAEALFNDARRQYQQHFQVQFSEWTNKPDEHGCNVFVGTFAPIDHSSKRSWIKYWVQRDQVSAHAGRTAKDLKSTSFVTKTIYVLRLFKLQAAITDPDAEEASDTAAVTRVYHPLPRTECYTTLDAANRAAKSLQIALSHKPNPIGLDKIWQTTNLVELNKKMSDLQQAEDEGQYWKCEFNGSGLGSATFELVVEKAGLCGPRNL